MGKRTKQLREKRSLKREFLTRGLDLSQVWCPHAENPALEIHQLKQLLLWVKKYEQCGSRIVMENQGFLFPPIDPDFSPDVDWDRFEKWMKKEPLSVRLRDLMPADFQVTDPSQMSDAEIDTALDRICQVLVQNNFLIETHPDVPNRLVFAHILDAFFWGDEEIPTTHVNGSRWHFDGCTGYCPDCFQRPWCEGGQEDCWPEDEKAGKMAVPECVLAYVSCVPFDPELQKRIDNFLDEPEDAMEFSSIEA